MIIKILCVLRPLSLTHLSLINHLLSLIMAVTGRQVPGVFSHLSSPPIIRTH